VSSDSLYFEILLNFQLDQFAPKPVLPPPPPPRPVARPVPRQIVAPPPPAKSSVPVPVQKAEGSSSKRRPISAPTVDTDSESDERLVKKKKTILTKAGTKGTGIPSDVEMDESSEIEEVPGPKAKQKEGKKIHFVSRFLIQ
jgi:hypothetical protein